METILFQTTFTMGGQTYTMQFYYVDDPLVVFTRFLDESEIEVWPGGNGTPPWAP